MAPQFIEFKSYPDAFAQGYNTFGGLDEVFNRAIQMGLQAREASERVKMLQRQQQLEEQRFQINRTVQAAQLGFDPGSISPDDMTMAQSGGAMLSRNPNAVGLQEYLQREKKKQGGELEQNEAKTRLANAQASLFEGGGGFDINGPETTIKNGIEYRRTMTRQGPQWVPLPPAPIAVDPSTGEMVQLPRGGKIVSSPGAAKASEIVSKAQSMRSAIDTQEKLLSQTPSGRITGGAAMLANKLTGAFPEVAAASGMSGVLQNMIARVISGEVGNLSETDLKVTQGLVPKVNGTRKEQALVLKELRALIDRKESEAKKNMQPGIFKQGKKGTKTDAIDALIDRKLGGR